MRMVPRQTHGPKNGRLLPFCGETAPLHLLTPHVTALAARCRVERGYYGFLRA